jgi:phosphoribosylamine---glycine ligase
MKILYLSPDAEFSIPQRLQAEGHAVECWTSTKPPYLQGVVKTIGKNWKPVAARADLIISDDILLEDLAALETMRKPTVVGNTLFTKIENDRLFGKLAFKKCGLTTSDCIHFTDFKKAIQWITANPGRYVFKASGQASRTLGFVAKEESGKDMCARLAFYEAHVKTNRELWDKELGVDFVLERAVDGIEVACGAYWDGRDFAAININWEHKRLGVGNVGVATGEMGTAVTTLPTESRLYRDTLAKLRPLLEASPYHTYVDLNCIVTKDAAFILEVTARLGWPIECALSNMSRLPMGTRYAQLASGTLHTADYWKHTWGIAVVVGTFGYPYECSYEEFGQNQPFNLPRGKDAQIFLMQANKVKNHWETPPNGEGATLVVVGTGDSLEAARESAFDVVEDLDLPGKMYRTDIGDNVRKHIKNLKSWGWL